MKIQELLKLAYHFYALAQVYDHDHEYFSQSKDIESFKKKVELLKFDELIDLKNELYNEIEKILYPKRKEYYSQYGIDLDNHDDELPDDIVPYEGEIPDYLEKLLIIVMDRLDFLKKYL